MFVLKKILNGRINVSEPLYMTAAVNLKAGEAVKHGTSGTLVKVSPEDTAEYVVIADAKATEAVPVILVTKEMLFDTTASGAVSVGKKYQFATSADGIIDTAANSGFGACVMAYADGVATVRLA